MEAPELIPVPEAQSSRRRLAFSDSTPMDSDNKPDGALPQPSAIKSEKGPAKKSYEQMMLEAISENDSRRKGISFMMIKKIITDKYLMGKDVKLYMKKAYEKLKEKKMVENATGNGFSGSIRLTKEYTVELASKEKKKDTKKVPKKAKTAKKKDKNNNKKEVKTKKKPTDAVTINPKKTAITKTKIDRSGGKVRLSITPVPVVQGKGTKGKAVAKAESKTKKAGPKTNTAVEMKQSAKVKESEEQKPKKQTTKNK